MALGRELLWLHTFAERFRDTAAGRGAFVSHVAGIGWQQPVTRMPQTAADIAYTKATRQLQVGDGVISGVREDVWGYAVSGMPIVKHWLGYRTAKGAGRAASSKNPLDHVRPTAWPDAWNDELLDLLRVLTRTLDLQPAQAALLDRICAGPRVSAAELPTPTMAQRKPPR